MSETPKDFSSDLRISVAPVAVALVVVAGLLRLYPATDTSDHAFSMLFSIGTAGVAALALWIESKRPLMGRWFVVGAIGVLLCVWGARFDVPEVLCLLVVPAALAATLLGVRAALVATAGVSMVLIAALLVAPRIAAPGVRPALVWVTLGTAWIIYALMAAVYQRATHLAAWSWGFYKEGLGLSETAHRSRAELLQAIDDLTYANRQLALAEKRVIAQRALAEEAQQAKAAFVARVSHEFRSPLNIIIGMVNLMVETPELYAGTFPPQAAAHLRIVYRTCRHLAGMIDDVLDMSQAEAGRIILHYSQANLADVLHGVIELVQPVIREKGLTCTVAVPSTLPVVACDVMRIRQIALNLLSNAARLTERGGITVTAEAEGAGVLLSVRDTGPGIAPDEAQRIFEPYYRGSAALGQWQDSQGSGLGLSISKHLVMLHGGEMWLETALGVGTTFYVRLPFSPPSTPVATPNRWIQEDWEWHERESRPSFATAHYKPRVVVCDPRGGLYAALSRVSDRVELVETRVLSDALAEVRRSAAQVLMINAGSVEALWSDAHHAARQAPDVPVVGCVCHGGIPPHVADGVATYLIKPVSRDNLHDAIDALARPVERVLIVDDDADTRELLSFYVKAYDVGISIEMAETGAQALAALQNARPDLILLDLVLGEVDGWQILEAKAHNHDLADTPVIIVTAQDPTPAPPRSQVLLATMGDGIALEKLVDGAAVVSAVMSGAP